jgi:hypothetical protein
VGHSPSDATEAVGHWYSHTTALAIVLATRVHGLAGHAQVLTGDGWRAVDADYVHVTSEWARRGRLQTMAEWRTTAQGQRTVRGQRRAAE